MFKNKFIYLCPDKLNHKLLFKLFFLKIILNIDKLIICDTLRLDVRLLIWEVYSFFILKI